MCYWVRIASLFIYLHIVDSNLIDLGHGRCRREWTVPERRVEFYTAREQCKYYERCYYKNVTKTRSQIVDKPMHVDFCCAGYISQGSFELLCQPTCEPMCVNGDCTAPGNCTCHKGYGKSPSSNHVCEHKCVPACVNATCVGVNDCDCYAGFFKKDPVIPHTCSPRCTFGCIHGDCTAPEICTCHPGYTLSSNHSVCIPVCNLECTNGLCSAPNTCSCDEGYVETPAWNVCDPYCTEPCINGQCTSPENCTCWDGYAETSNATCAPHCTNPCLNGACIAPEICYCDEGYEKDENDTCIPICSLGCENGTCASPDNCLCEDRHYFSDGTCLPWCAEGCTNGDCTGPNECSCRPETLKMSQSYCAKSCSNDYTCIQYSSSVDTGGSSTTLNLALNSSIPRAMEANMSFCSQEYSESCCTAEQNVTRNDSLIIVCSPKDKNAECDQITLPHYLQTNQYGEMNDANITVIVATANITFAFYASHDTEQDARLCYLRLCPGPEFSFRSGLTRILCSQDLEIGDRTFDDSDLGYKTLIATIGALTFLISVAIMGAIFYYIKRIKKISYDVNDGVAGEHLYHDQDVTLEDEL